MNKSNTVLLIEDDEVTAEVLTRQLLDAGLAVEWLENALDLRMTFLRVGPCTIVSDTDLPQLDGDMAIRQLVDEGIIDREKTLIIGMSDVRDNEEAWVGLAHKFYYKPTLIRIGLGNLIASEGFLEKHLG